MVGDRAVTVTLRADIDSYSRALKMAAAETAGFAKSVDNTRSPLSDMENDSKRTGNEIDKLSGRLRVAADLLAVLGPAGVAAGAGAIGGMVALSAQLGVTAGAVGITVLAFHGMGDALKALDQYQLEPTAEHLTKLNETMAGLGPAGATFVRQLDSMEPALKSLQMEARNGLLPGAGESLNELLTLLPQVRLIVHRFSEDLGGLAADAGAALSGDKFEGFFKYLQHDGTHILDDTARTVGNLTEAVVNLFVAFEPTQRGFSSGLLDFSRGLAKASEGLGTNQGFQEFVSYINKEGPHALETLGALGDALLQIVEAGAPLGGPVLSAITAVAKAIATIADSDLGTPISAALLTLSLFNRTQALTGRLVETSWGRTAQGNLRGFAANLGVVTTAQQRAQMSAQELQIVEAERAATMRAGFGTLAKGAAGLGALAVASGALGDSLQQSDAITLGLAGSMGGPLTGALGVAAGSALDLKHANDGLNESLTAMDLAKATGDVDAYAASIENAGKQLEATTGGPHASDLLHLGGGFKFLKDDAAQQLDALTGKTRDAADAINAAAIEEQGLRDGSLHAFNPVQALAGAITSAATAAEDQAKATQDAIDAMRSQRVEALRALNAQLNYQQAILDANAALKENGKDFSKTTEAGIKNRQLVYGLADAWNQQSDAAKNAKGSLASARQNFIETATALGATAAQARSLASRLFEIPPKRKTQIELDGADQAISTAKTLKQILDSLHSKNIDIALHYQTIGNKPKAPTPGGTGTADGGTVPTSGMGYADRYHYMLADGEEVISNRYGQADRHRQLLKAINAGRLANGGTAHRGGGLDTPLFTGEGPRYYKAAYKHNRPFALDGPAKWDWPYQTTLPAQLAQAFEDWANNNPVYFDTGARITDYDMRGFWLKKRPKSWHEGDHFPDTWKTPYDTTFSHESKYATKDNPFYWHGDKLIDTRTGQVVFASGGATVPKTGRGYADRHPYMLADGEEVISNRHGQADRHRSLLKAINAGRMADGGTTGASYHSMLGGSSGGGGGGPTVQAWTDGVYTVAKALRAFKAELDAATTVVDKDKQARQNAIDAEQAFASSVGGAYSKADLFSGGLSEFDAGAQANTNDSQAAQAALATAAGNGLDGPLYQALAASGNLSLVQQFAGLSAAEIAQREQEFGAQSTAQIGLGASAADTAGLTQAVKDTAKELNEARKERQALAAAVKHLEAELPKNVEDGARKGVAERDKRTHAHVRAGG